MEARAMSQADVGARPARTSGHLLLRLHVALLRANPLTLAAGALLLAVAGSLWWTAYAVGTLKAQQAARRQLAAPALARAGVARTAMQLPTQPLAPLPGIPVPEPDNLAAFYATLGGRSAAEEQVRTLFALAAKNGLRLAQGEYKSAYDRNAQVWTYQVNLPVKGSYAAIWQFAFGALRTIPFASLDDIGFRRDTIGDPQVEARLRLTLYLSERGAGQPDGVAGGAP
jgi:hypothetical protein